VVTTLLLHDLPHDHNFARGHLINDATEAIRIRRCAFLEERQQVGLRPPYSATRDELDREGTHLHVHLTNRVVLQIRIIVFQNIIIIERHPFRPEHVRDERELLFRKALLNFFFIVPLLVLRVI
jgi:hypothetical protein